MQTQSLGVAEIEAAIRYFDEGHPHPYGAATQYLLIHRGSAYPPKAIVGIARSLQHNHSRPPPGVFSSGLRRTQAVGILKELGYRVESFATARRYAWTLPGYLMLADQDWMEQVLSNSNSSVLYARKPGGILKIPSHSPVYLMTRGEQPRAIRLVGKLAFQERMSVADAWRDFQGLMHYPDENTAMNQLSQFADEHGQIALLRFDDLIKPAQPVDVSNCDITVSPRSVRGQHLSLLEVRRINQQLLEDQEIQNSDFTTGLNLYRSYSREQVRDHFVPTSQGQSVNGSWGQSGTVSLPSDRNSYVFFVTQGQQSGEHEFDEYFTASGIFHWQSQPSKKLSDPQIKSLIEHKSRCGTIYLFWRAKAGTNYTFLGTLQYFNHSPDHEKPVHFQWLVENWPVPASIAASLNLQIRESIVDGTENYNPGLHKGSLPTNSVDNSDSTDPSESSFKGRKIDYAKRDQSNRKLGLLGEKLVLEHEKKKLSEAGRHDLAEKVEHTSVIQGDGTGFDIRSFTKQGEVIFIEVKSTQGPHDTPFFISDNELQRSAYSDRSFYLYRLYDLRDDPARARFYTINGNLKNQLELNPQTYRARLIAAENVT